MATKAELEATVAAMQEQVAALTAAAKQNTGSAQRKADTISTARFSYQEGGDTKLVLLVNKRKRIMLSQSECDAIVKASNGFDWSPGAPVYVK